MYNGYNTRFGGFILQSFWHDSGSNFWPERSIMSLVTVLFFTDVYFCLTIKKSLNLEKYNLMHVTLSFVIENHLTVSQSQFIVSQKSLVVVLYNMIFFLCYSVRWYEHLFIFL